MRHALPVGLLALALLADRAAAEPQRWVPVAGKSRVSFEAFHRLGDFTGRAEDVSGEFEADPADLKGPITGILRVRATALWTGDKGRDRNLHEALGAERHSEIRFVVERVEASFASLAEKTDVLLTVHGILAVHGVEQPVRFLARARLLDGQVWLRGDAVLRMTAFGITPPRRFFMAVKDEIRAHVDLLLRRAE